MDENTVCGEIFHTSLLPAGQSPDQIFTNVNRVSTADNSLLTFQELADTFISLMDKYSEQTGLTEKLSDVLVKCRQLSAFTTQLLNQNKYLEDRNKKLQETVKKQIISIVNLVRIFLFFFFN